MMLLAIIVTCAMSVHIMTGVEAYVGLARTKGARSVNFAISVSG